MGIAGNMANILQSTSPLSDPEPGDTPGNDPSSYSITTVQAWIGDHPEDTLTALTAEVAGSNRATLVAWLEAKFVTGATAGIPGAFTPAGKIIPATVADLIAGAGHVVVASPLTLWTVGQYVQTATAGAPGQAHWNGTAWVAGVAPA